MKKFIALLFCLILCLSGCADDARSTDTVDGQFPVIPLAQTGSGNAQPISLYFGYLDEDMLAVETRMLEMPLDSRPETYIINLLIQGPSVTYADLRSVFNSDVRIVSIESSARMLIVTLSREFLDPPADAPVDWREDAAWIDKIQKRNRLALYSIVNTITEMGDYDRVQIQVESSDANMGVTAQRMKKSDFALAESNKDDSLLGPVGRVHDAIMSPRRVVDLAMDAWVKKDWEKLYTYLATQDSSSPLPARDAVITALSSSPISMLRHNVLDTTISDNGKNSTVSLDIEFMLASGAADTLYNTNILLVREHEAWKILYASIDALASIAG